MTDPVIEALRERARRRAARTDYIIVVALAALAAALGGLLGLGL